MSISDMYAKVIAFLLEAVGFEIAFLTFVSDKLSVINLSLSVLVSGTKLRGGAPSIEELHAAVVIARLAHR